MNSIRLLVQLTAITSILSGCANQNHDQMPHEDNQSDNTQQSQPQNSMWSRMKDRMGFSESSFDTPIQLDDHSQALARSGSLFSYVSSVCEANHLPSEAAFIPLLMSGYNSEYAEDGRSGLWGLNDAQAASLGLPNDYWMSGKNDIVLSTQVTASYLKYLNTTFKNWDLAVTAYKHGITPIMNAVHQNQSLGKPTDLMDLPLEPSMKVFAQELKLVSHQLIEQHMSMPHGNITEHEAVEVIDMPSQYDIAQAASLLNMDTQQLKQLNPGYKRPLTPPQGPFRILVPASFAPNANKLFKDPTTVSQTAKKPWLRHKVHYGESLSVIAQNYMTNVSDLRRVNNIKGDQIMVNQLILIPPIDRTEVRTKPSAIPGPQRIIHTVAQDETLYSISKHYSQNIQDVMYWNDLNDKGLHPGQKLVVWKNADITSPYIYKVKADDSLSKIARLHHTTVDKLKQINRLESSIIHPNSILVIPHQSK